MLSGLPKEEAARRLQRDGPNELKRSEGTPPFKILIRQFQSPLVLLLGVACGIAGALGEWADAVAIGVIIVLNGLVGFYQEYQAENSVMALRAMTAPRARVRREGEASVIPAAEVVVGDILVLEAGDLVAADARVVQAHALLANEAVLTGESVPVEKWVEGAPPAEEKGTRNDRVYAGTPVVAGAGEAEVLATGMNTELGKIAHLLATAQEESTPLQQKLQGVGRTLILLCLAVVAMVAALGLWRGNPWLEVLLSAVSLAVAAVPEGLPAVVTIALALGVQRMSRQNVLVRRLPSVETLGSATVICTDKTGTLTTGRMESRRYWTAAAGATPDPTCAPRPLLYAAAACNDADLSGSSGDPTELALLVAARAQGMERSSIEAENPRAVVLPFDSTRKRMSILRTDGVLYVKGAVDLLLPHCTSGTEGVERAHSDMAAAGLRVLGVASRRIGPELVDRSVEGLEKELELVGLVGIADPPRPEAIAAVALARKAGITTVMITGDHPQTAAAIAREMGILQPGEQAAERIHARVTPEEKLQIVRRWKQTGAVVAMTGDGVNDAPALREAHIGVAMGRAGTEVTREAADMILTDDNFASIVEAIREGRAIFDNIRKTLVYLLTGNVGELMLMLGTSLLGLPIPLLPLQLLWINLVTDGMPALALVVDPPAPGILERPPRPLAQPMLGRAEWLRILVGGSLDAAVVAGVFVGSLQLQSEEMARTMAFTTLVFVELFRAFSARDERLLFWEVGAFTNLRLLGVIAVSVVLQLGLGWWEPTASLFRLHPLTGWELLLCGGLGLVPVTLMEVSKLIRRLL
jgi:P-type Ca2+ transporter type 2C